MKNIFVALILTFIVSICQAKNLEDIIRMSRQLTSDTVYYTPTPRLSDQRIIDYINEGQQYMAAHGSFLINTTSFVLVGGTTEYAIPDDFQTVRRVALDGKWLKETSQDSLFSNQGVWGITSGQPDAYYVRYTTNIYIGFYPAPLITTTGTVVMDYLANAEILTELTDIPFFGLKSLYSLHDSLAKFVAYRFYLTAGNAELANIYAQEYTADMTRIKGIIEAKPNYKPGFSAETGRRR